MTANTSVLISDARVTVPHYNESHVSLLITAATLEDSGNYTCSVTNHADGTLITTVVLIEGV